MVIILATLALTFYSEILIALVIFFFSRKITDFILIALPQWRQLKESQFDNKPWGNGLSGCYKIYLLA